MEQKKLVIDLTVFTDYFQISLYTQPLQIVVMIHLYINICIHNLFFHSFRLPEMSVLPEMGFVENKTLYLQDKLRILLFLLVSNAF